MLENSASNESVKETNTIQNVYIVSLNFLRRSGGIRSAQSAANDGPEPLSSPTLLLKKIGLTTRICRPFECAILTIRFLFSLGEDHAEISLASRTTTGNPPTRLRLFRRSATVCGARWERCGCTLVSGLHEAHQHNEQILRSSGERRDACAN